MDKSRSHFRWYYTNANGITDTTSKEVTCPSIGSCFINSRADMLSITETKLNTNLPHAQYQIRRSLKSVDTHAPVLLAQSPFETTGFSKPGGLLHTIRGPYVGRIRDRATDPLARWTYFVLQGRDDKQIAFINIYQPPRNHNKPGATTVYAQHVSYYQKQKRTVTNPHLNFTADLRILLRGFKDKKIEFVITGDFNETPTEKLRGISSLIRHFKLANPFQILHPQATKFNTYNRGKRIIDYTLVTPALLPSIARIGYTPFSQFFGSDHRGGFIDFDISLLFGRAPLPLPPPSARDINAKRPTDVTKYLLARNDYSESHSITARVKRLCEQPLKDEKTAQAIMRDIERSAFHGGRRVRRGKCRLYCPEIAKLRKDISDLRFKLMAVRYNYTQQPATSVHPFTGAPDDSSHSTATTTATADSDTSLPPGIPITIELNDDDPDSIRRRLRCLRAQLRKADRLSEEKREKFLISQLAYHRFGGRIAEAKSVAMILKMETRNRAFHRLHHTLSPDSKSGITSIDVPVNDTGNYDPELDPETATTWKTITDPHEIHRCLIRRNIKHFGQASGTPLTTPEFVDLFGFTGSSAASHQVLNGTYAGDHAPIINEVLQEMRQKSPISITPDVTIDEFRKKMFTWKEETTTSPSGLHLGHYRALVRRHSYDHIGDRDKAADQDKKKLLNSIQEDCLYHHVAMINYARKHQIVYDRWRTIITTMIPKDEGVVKINRVRIIHLYECDLTATVSIHWRRTVYNAEHHRLLHPTAYGSRPGRDAKSPVFLEELQNEIYRLTRTQGVHFDNDATACYDRILPFFAAMASMSFGANTSMSKFAMVILLNALYRLKTTSGMAQESYSHTALHPIFGSGQGSGNSPMLWLFICSILMDAHFRLSNGARFFNPQRTLHSHVSSTSFVDDANGRTNLFGQDPHMPLLLETATNDVQLWHQLLRVSGGDLSLAKCKLYIVDWEFYSGGTPHMVAHPNTVMTFPTEDGDFTITATPVDESHKTLGHYKNPAGCMKMQLEVTWKNIKTKIKLVVGRFMHPFELQLFYQCILIPSVTYVFACSHFTRSSLLSMQQFVAARLLPVMGYPTSLPSVITYAPQSIGGLGLYEFTFLQGIDQTTMFLRFWRSHCTIGQTLRIATHWFQQSAGFRDPVFANPRLRMPHCESKWLSSLRTFLSATSCSFDLFDSGVYPPQRKHDIHLMQYVCEDEYFKPIEIININRCRLYLQVTTLSDITTLDGRYIQLDYWVNPFPSTEISSPLDHPIHQEKPAYYVFNDWRKLLNRLAQQKTRKLRRRLGQWTVPAHQLRRKYKMYHHQLPHRAYLPHPTAPGFITYDILTKQQLDVPLRRQLPPNAYPAEFHSHYLLYRQQDPLPAPPTTLTELFQECATWETSFFANLQLLMSDDDISLHFANAKYDPLIRADTLIAGTDGSERTFGWKLALSDETTIAECSGPVPGITTSSFRTEAAALLSLRWFLSKVTAFMSLGHPRVIIHTDSKSNIDRIDGHLQRGFENVMTHTSADFDLTSGYLQLETQHPKSVILRHVTSHQDDDAAIETLSFPARLNIRCDELAGQYQIPPDTNMTHVPVTPWAAIQLNSPRGTITSRHKSLLRDELYLPPYKAAVLQTYNITAEDTIDWTARQRIIKSQPTTPHFLLKFTSGYLPTYVQQKAMKFVPTDQCPLCDTPNDDQLHFLCCNRTAASRANLLLRLTDIRLPTVPNLMHLIVTGIYHELDPTLPLPTSTNPELQQFLTDQTRLGWLNIFRLVISKYLRQYIKPIQVADKAEQQALRPESKRNRRRNPEQESFTIIKTIGQHLIKAAKEMWDTRNVISHNGRLAHSTILIHSKIRDELHQIYAKRDQLPVLLRAKLFPTIADHYRLCSMKQIADWINQERHHFLPDRTNQPSVADHFPIIDLT